MTERNRSAVDIDFVAIELEVANVFFRDNRKRLVDSNRSISSSESPAFAGTFRVAGTGVLSISVGESPHICHRDHARPRLEPVSFRVSGRGQQDRRGAIDYAR